MSATVYTRMESPVGPLLLTAGEGGLRLVHFVNGRRPRSPDAEWRRDDRAFAGVTGQLKAYFAGELKEFDVPLCLEGTEFQVRVWRELQKIPYGETTSYGELAKRLGDAKLARAVGLANGANPIPIIVPCHRVIGSDGSLTGFGGGLPTKKKLLALESKQLRLL